MNDTSTTPLPSRRDESVVRYVPVSVSAASASGTNTRPPTEAESVYDRGFRARMNTRYVDYPAQIGIETLAVCNASCSFCAYPAMERRGDRMSDGLVEKIFDDMDDMPADLPFELSFSRVNEPFLDKRFFDIATEANRRFPQARLWVFTNASPLVSRLCRQLPRLERIDQFVISFADHRPAEYERVMGLPFAQTAANVDRVHGMAEAGKIRFRPTISRVGDGSPDDDAFIAWAAERWPLFPARSTHRFQWFGQSAATVHGGVPATPCHQWFHLPILASGHVTYCCIDHEGSHSYGDVRDAHLLDVYNRPDRRRLREIGPDRREIDLCRTCNHLG